MGQSVNVQAKQIDGFCIFTTDRVITGQDGSTYASVAEAEGEAGFAAELALRLFGSDSAVDHIYVASSEVVVRRNEGWDEAAIAAASTTITDLYRFYSDS